MSLTYDHRYSTFTGQYWVVIIVACLRFSVRGAETLIYHDLGCMRYNYRQLKRQPTKIFHCKQGLQFIVASNLLTTQMLSIPLQASLAIYAWKHCIRVLSICKQRLQILLLVLNLQSQHKHAELFSANISGGKPLILWCFGCVNLILEFRKLRSILSF